MSDTTAAALAGLRFTQQLEAGAFVQDAVVALRYVDEEGRPVLFIAMTESIDPVVSTGLLEAARQVAIGQWHQGGDDDD